ncbi:tail fiber domain-containing protein [Candidatus Peregrinibacteria bacterium]|nr:tail fiber domain-containing protein [Candidatus Peregrinibacteria bacterium]
MKTIKSLFIIPFLALLFLFPQVGYAVNEVCYAGQDGCPDPPDSSKCVPPPVLLLGCPPGTVWIGNASTGQCSPAVTCSAGVDRFYCETGSCWTQPTAGPPPPPAACTTANVTTGSANACCTDGQIVVRNGTSNTWECADLTPGLWSETGVNDIYFDGGNVGVGTDAPLSKFHVDGQLRISNAANSANYLTIGHGGTHSYFNNEGVGNIELRIGGNTKLAVEPDGSVISDEYCLGTDCITEWPSGGLWSESTDPGSIYYNDGNVGIGTNIPAYELDVAGDANATRLCINGDCKPAWPTYTGADLWEENWGHVYRPTGHVAVGLPTTTTPGGVLQVATDVPVVINNCESSFLIGTCTGPHVEMDSNSLQAKATNVTVATLNLQELGGNLQVDGSTLVVDGTNNKVGIGTTSPAGALHIATYQEADLTNAEASFMIGPTTSYHLEMDSNDIQGKADTVHAGTLNLQADGGSLDVGNNNNLFVETATSRVGINTDDPAYALHVIGQVNGSTGLCIAGVCRTTWPESSTSLWTENGSNIYRSGGGNVGIDDTVPLATLSVVGQVRASDLADEAEYIEIDHGGANALINWAGDGNLDFRRTGTTLMTLEQDGDLGIGDTTPDAKLDVEGGIRAHSIYGENNDTFDITSADNYFIDLESNDDTYGLIIRESTVQNGDATADYLNIEPKDTYTGFGASQSGADLLLYEDGKLEIVNGPDNNGSTASLVVGDGSNTLYMDGNEIDSDGSLYLQHNSSGNVYIDGGGKVTIGTATPAASTSLTIVTPTSSELYYTGIDVSSPSNGVGIIGRSTGNTGVMGTTDYGVGVIGMATHGNGMEAQGGYAGIMAGGDTAGGIFQSGATSAYIAYAGYVVDGNGDIRASGSILPGSSKIYTTNGDLVFEPNSESADRFYVSNEGQMVLVGTNGIWLASASYAGKIGGGTWTNSSDARLKDVHGAYEKGLADILGLKPVTFNYKKDNPKGLPSNDEYIGFIAQDVEPIFPEAISTDDDGYLQFDMHSINVAAINAIKQLKAEKDAEIAELKAVVCELKPEAEVCNK